MIIVEIYVMAQYIPSLKYISTRNLLHTHIIKKSKTKKHLKKSRKNLERHLFYDFMKGGCP